jgi:hypothetical protein
MGKILKIELKRAFKNKAFYLSFAIGAALCIWLKLFQVQEVRELEKLISEYGTEKLGVYYLRNLYNSFIGLDYAYLPSIILYTIFPLLVTMPHALSYYSDKKSGYIKNILIKTGRKEYFFTKYAAVFLSGFVLTLAILFFDLWLSALFFPALIPEAGSQTFSPMLQSQMLVELFYTHPLIYTIIYIFIDAVFFGLLATVALAVSMAADNLLLVFSGGMILYLFVDYLTKIFDKWNFSPIRFLKPNQLDCEAKPWIIFSEIVILIVAVILPFFLKERKKDVF